MGGGPDPGGRPADERQPGGPPSGAADANARADLPDQARAARRRLGGRRGAGDGDRSLVPLSDGRADRGGALVRGAGGVGGGGGGSGAPSHEGHGVLGPPAR